MEYFWYVIAALGAGVTTGLVGLSAAAVMVPILIVLCPTFAVDGGQFQAVAIALASDVLASIVSTAIYIRHKNIDLKRSWIMIVCVLTMCIVGTIIAFYIPNHINSAFSLALCVFIGVRFLIQPDPQGKRLVPKGTKLDKKGIIFSVLFGLAIGLIVGYVGTGGGLMMLLVFTLFFGMERRTAVGTSTFIMALAALVAFGAHAVAEVDILLERWDVLAICAPVATLGAVVSSLFANKVNGKVVGIVTGAILTVLGIVLLILNFFVMN
ncbi:MAG: sulfite exporter TauE/SafE family protein [Clostridiales bacterium]|nr:sulfite exporter TauE/SafE family protein [Clostridiales bacterium]